MKANENEILTIAGKRVRVAYRKPGEDCCARCCFNGGETCAWLIEDEEWPCGKFNLATAYFVDAEQPEVDLEKLGEIARHLIAVKQHIEDMRLSEDEWSLIERIGYPERFSAKK